MAISRVQDIIFRGIIIGGLVSMLLACSMMPAQPENNYSRKSMQSLYQLEYRSFEGRLALTGKNDSWSANINWEHSPGNEKIKLSGPLGQGAIVISLAGNVVTLDRGGGDVKSSVNPEEFISREVGIIVPVTSLRYWVLGLPEPNSSFVDTQDGFGQSGWVNEYKQMQLVGINNLPHKMIVMNDQVKLKLIVDHWNLQ